jgi:hypothetical protein
MMEDKEITFEEAQDVLQRINQEGFHYCFVHYSKFDEIKNKKFHKLRKNYLKTVKELENYLQSIEDNEN